MGPAGPGAQAACPVSLPRKAADQGSDRDVSGSEAHPPLCLTPGVGRLSAEARSCFRFCGLSLQRPCSARWCRPENTNTGGRPTAGFRGRRQAALAASCLSGSPRSCFKRKSSAAACKERGCLGSAATPPPRGVAGRGIRGGSPESLSPLLTPSPPTPRTATTTSRSPPSTWST